MNDFLCFWNKSQVLSIYSVLGDKLYDKRKPIPQWMIYKSLCLNYLLCWISTIINNFRQKSGLLQMRLLVSCREYRIFLLFPDILFDFSIARLTIGASDPFVTIQIRHQGIPVAIGSDFMQFHECGISSAVFFALHELTPFPKEMHVPVFSDDTSDRH